MKNVFDGLITAFSMYSILPMPQKKWNRDSMKYALCFLPLVGAIIGAVVYGWCVLCQHLELGALLFATVATLLPIFLSGGIHLDGFIDTSDALYSRREREKKLEILKDPHVGAFGVMMCGGLLLLEVGLYGQLYENMKFLPIVLIGFVFSRNISALSVISFKKAKTTGLVATFSENSSRSSVVVFILLNAVLLVILCDFSVLLTGAVAIVLFAWLFLYRQLVYREFGGVTGDTAGFFLHICELLLLIIAVVGGVLW